MTVLDSPEPNLNIGLLFFIPYRAMESRVAAALHDAGYDFVTTAQRRVFGRIGHEGTRLTDLAEQAQMSKQATGFLVDQLERSGYVERVADPVDGRARLVRFSERGRAMVEIGRAAAAEMEAEWAEYLGEERMAELRRTLTTLREITDL